MASYLLWYKKGGETKKEERKKREGE